MSNDILDIAKIRSMLPHRYPFLLVDRIVKIKKNESVVGIKNVTANEPFFNGHFPGKPVMPGVLIVEALAQTSGILVICTVGGTPDYDNGDYFYLAGMNNVRFKKMVIPGDQLRLEVTLVKQKLDLWKFKGEAFVGDELACSAEFMNIRGG